MTPDDVVEMRISLEIIDELNPVNNREALARERMKAIGVDSNCLERLGPSFLLLLHAFQGESEASWVKFPRTT